MKLEKEKQIKLMRSEQSQLDGTYFELKKRDVFVEDSEIICEEQYEKKKLWGIDENDKLDESV